MASPCVRLRFHATGPDGRQVGPVDVDVPVQLPAPVIRVVRVSDFGGGFISWDTDGFCVSYGTTEPAFKINGVSPISTETIGPGDIGCRYDFTVEVGMPWSIDTQPETLYCEFPFAIPQSGVVG
jgi:hypothetical protein